MENNKEKRIRYGSIFWNITKKSKIIYLFAVFILLYFVFTTIIFYTDRHAFANYGDALWFTFASIFTIGYGDFTVTTVLSRIFTVILVIYAIIITAIFTAIWANMISEILKVRVYKHEPKEIEKLCNLENLSKEELKALSDGFKEKVKEAKKIIIDVDDDETIENK